jgi:drug/metabolite transporter (DMT)-like permease
MRSKPDRAEFLALIALFAGALATGSSGIFVRLSETGPTATGFWRGLLSLPLLAVWALVERRGGDESSHAFGPRELLSTFRNPLFFWGGVCFAGDLALWHWALFLTSVAVSTLEANLAPLVVTAIAWLAWRERPHPRFLFAIMLALTGMLLIVSPKLGHGGSAFFGDVLGFGTACFYAGYILIVARLRRHYGTGIVMFNTTLIFTLLLLPIALTQKLMPDTAYGWTVLVGCALSAQIVGQGLIAYALKKLPATFGSIGLYLQSIGAAAYAWVLLGEHLAAVQIAGGGVVLSAIALARSARNEA